jgi:hypothetical protein
MLSQYAATKISAGLWGGGAVRPKASVNEVTVGVLYWRWNNLEAIYDVTFFLSSIDLQILFYELLSCIVQCICLRYSWY